MNVKEGVRRLALFLGVLGAVLGLFVSYLVLRDVLGATARYKAFELLAKSDAVQQERNSWSVTLAYTPDKAIETFRKLPANQQRDVFGRLTQDERSELVAKLKCEPLPSGSPSTATTLGNLSQVIAGHRTKSSPVDYDALAKKFGGVDAPAEFGGSDAPQPGKDDPYACLEDSSDPPASTVNRDGIKTIRWTKGLGVESVETEDGKTVYPAPAPNRWLYLLAAILPPLGFVLPWGLVRAVGWVGAGFFTS